MYCHVYNAGNLKWSAALFLKLGLYCSYSCVFYCGVDIHYLSLVMRKPAFCICENKAAEQLRGNREADQRLCFRYTDNTIPLLHKSKISSILSSSLIVQFNGETPE